MPRVGHFPSLLTEIHLQSRVATIQTSSSPGLPIRVTLVPSQRHRVRSDMVRKEGDSDGGIRGQQQQQQESREIRSQAHESGSQLDLRILPTSTGCHGSSRTSTSSLLSQSLAGDSTSSRTPSLAESVGGFDPAKFAMEERRALVS